MGDISFYASHALQIFAETMDEVKRAAREFGGHSKDARRDLFAAAALTGMGPWTPNAGTTRAEWAVREADALLSELDKEPG